MKRHFATFDEFMEAVRKPGHPENRAGCTSLTATEGWTGTRNYTHALELLEKGWPEGLARIQQLKGNIKVPRAETETVEFQYVEAGDEADVGRFLTGEPENMIEYKRQFVPGSGRVVRLLLNAFASSGIENEAIFLRGAAAFALADAIERTGLRAEIALVLCAKSNRHDNVFSDVIVPVKAADQQLEPDRLAFLLAHPSLFRRFMGRLYEQETVEEFSKHWTSWGQPADLTPIPDDTVYFGSLSWGLLKSIEQCAAYVQKMLSKYTEEDSFGA